MAERLYSIKEIADKCGKNPRTIRYFTDAEGLGKKNGKEWKFTETETIAIFRHYGIAAAIEEIEEKRKSETEKPQTENAANAEIDITAGQSQYLTDFIDSLRKQIETKDEQLKNADEEKKKLHIELEEKDKQIANFQEQIGELIKTNNNLSLPQATQALTEAKEIISIEQPKEQEDKAIITKEPEQEQEIEVGKFSFGEWWKLRRAWKQKNLWISQALTMM